MRMESVSPGSSSAHERTAFTEAMLLAGALDAVIAQDPGHLVRSAIRVLRARCDGREPLASQETIRIEILMKENLGGRAGGQRAPASQLLRGVVSGS